MGASYYVGAAHPPDMDARSEDVHRGRDRPRHPGRRRPYRGAGGRDRRGGLLVALDSERAQGAPGVRTRPAADGRAPAHPSRTERRRPGGDRGCPPGRRRGPVPDDHRPHRADAARALGHEEARGDGMRSRVRPVRARALVLQALAGHRHDQRRRAPEAARLAHRGGPRADSSSWRTIRPRSRTSSATAGAAMPTSCRTSCPGCARAGSRKRTSRRCWWRRRDGSWPSRPGSAEARPGPRPPASLRVSRRRESWRRTSQAETRAS